MAQRNAVPAALAMALLALGAGVAFFVTASVPEVEIERPVQVAEPIPPPRTSAPGEINRVESPRDPSSEPTTPEPATPKRNRMARDLERERIWSALNREHALQPANPGSAAPSQQDAKKLPQLDPEYVKTALTEQLLPVANECYDSALEDDAKLSGELLVEFTIIGAEDIGGVVEDATIDDASSLDSAFVRECVRESLMAVTFEPPPDGGLVVVSFPIEFRPDE